MLLLLFIYLCGWSETRRIPSSEMCHRVTLARTEASEERNTPIIRGKRYSELGNLLTANDPSSLILFTLMIEAKIFSETFVLTRATRHRIPEDSILHSHRHENFKHYGVENVHYYCGH
jgi:hypothetical protein